MRLKQLLEQATEQSDITVAVAAAHDLEVLEAVVNAVELNMANFILFGDKEKIINMLHTVSSNGAKYGAIKIVHSPSLEDAAKSAVEAVHNAEASLLMKGNVPTATIFKTVLNNEYGLRTNNVLSHVAAFEIPGYDRLIFVTDAAMNIAPDLMQKAQMMEMKKQS
ncbi:phosphate acyltransferase [Bacillus sp. JJ722]|uniref:phosphate acyltransferase n=1 Tax=Bacillus sp. JJ722 TaxID=3122973 RepID=UPI002FFE4A7E